MTDIYKLLFLISCIGPAKPRIWELAQYFDSFDDMYDVLMSSNASAYFSPAEMRNASRTTRQQIETVTDYCRANNISILTFDDSRYPDRLRRLLNPPALIFCKGKTDILSDDIIISVVGARNISEYTKRAEKYLTAALASSGVTIASGFAVGTDILANLTAVRNGGRTIAVLGCGIDYSYPAENMRYVDEIISNGVIISEYFPKASAQRLNFPVRNRLIAALSSGVAIMEASDRSGSLNIAQQCQNQGKDIWVMSVHDITDNRYNGGKELLRSGALPVYGAEDILNMYFENSVPRQVKERASDYLQLKEEPDSPGKTGSEKPEFTPPKQFMSKEPELKDDEKKIFDILKEAHQISADEIADLMQADLFDILTILTDFELRGFVTSADGQIYSFN